MYTPCSRIMFMVAMETMHFFIEQKSLDLTTKIICISGVKMSDLAPLKDCPGRGCARLVKLAPGVPGDKCPCCGSNELGYFIFIQNKCTFARPKKLKHWFSYFPKTVLNNYTKEISANRWPPKVILMAFLGLGL